MKHPSQEVVNRPKVTFAGPQTSNLRRSTLKGGDANFREWEALYAHVSGRVTPMGTADAAWQNGKGTRRVGRPALRETPVGASSRRLLQAWKKLPYSPFAIGRGLWKYSSRCRAGAFVCTGVRAAKNQRKSCQPSLKTRSSCKRPRTCAIPSSPSRRCCRCGRRLTPSWAMKAPARNTKRSCTRAARCTRSSTNPSP